MTGKRIYIAGPMTGVPRFNRPAFVKAAVEFNRRKFGWKPRKRKEPVEE